MAVIKEYKIGDGLIRVHDDAICSPEEAKEIWKRVTMIAKNELIRRELEKRKKSMQSEDSQR